LFSVAGSLLLVSVGSEFREKFFTVSIFGSRSWSLLASVFSWDLLAGKRLFSSLITALICFQIHFIIRSKNFKKRRRYFNAHNARIITTIQKTIFAPFLALAGKKLKISWPYSWASFRYCWAWFLASANSAFSCCSNSLFSRVNSSFSWLSCLIVSVLALASLAQ